MDFSFGPYRLLAAQRILLEGDRPVRLGSRAFDILTMLVEHAGEVVGKDDLIARAWPATFVEETNLKIQVSALRRALGDGQGDNRFIATVVGRGYRFVAPVHETEPLPATELNVPHNLPFATTRMIGREETVTALVARLSRQRLVTIVGPGGIGKTTVALAVAEQVIADHENGVWLVDLAPLRDPALVAGAVATVLSLEIRAGDPLPGLVAALKDERVLLLLDNCEHVIDAVAGLATAVLSGTSLVRILATSREPLRISGEQVHRLGTLNTPGSSPRVTANEAAAYPAVQLFIERVTSIVEDFALTDTNAPLVSDICRRLDGLPLAIEFAAPRVQVLGIDGLAARLEDSFRLPGRRRAAAPRHRTMQAVVDWSHELLSQDEQRFFRALGIFAGGFTVEAAAAVTAAAASAGTDAIDRVADLVTKSLVVADVGDTRPRFRLLEMTRAYAVEKLTNSGERDAMARRHAAYYRALLAHAEREVPARPTADWLEEYGQEIDNLRAALDWAFAPGGDQSIAVALTVAAIPLWLQLPMVDECRRRVEQALASSPRGVPIDPRAEMKLQAALGASLLFTKGAIPAAGDASAAALRLADMLGDTEHQLRALWELWVHHTNTGEHVKALAAAQRFHTIALTHADAGTEPIVERMMGMSRHYLGDQTSAWRHIERMLSADADPRRPSPLIRFWFDQTVAARIVLARILWLRGFADQAWQTVRSAVGEAETLGDPATLCYALSHGGCLIALWVGDLAAAKRYADLLFDQSRKHGFAVWHDFASRLRGVILVKSGDRDGLPPRQRAGLNEVAEPISGLWFLTCLGEMAEVLGRAGRIDEGLATVERGISQSATRWLAPELLRIKGELLLSRGTPGTAEAVEDMFRRALDEAHAAGALSWELRTATSLARLLRQQGRPEHAVGCLQPVHERFTEGFGTADLIGAKQLLDDLRDAGHR